MRVNRFRHLTAFFGKVHHIPPFRVVKLASRRGLFALLAIGLLAAGVAGFFMSGAIAQAQEQETALPSHYDTDGDGLIEIGSLDQLNAVRWDLDGNGSPSTGNEDAYSAAFPVADEGSVCPADTTCTGFELTADLDFDENGDGEITAADAAYWNEGAGWAPIGGFSGVLEGNGHTIANLFIDRSGTSYVGLFGSVVEDGIVRNLGLTGVSVKGQNYVGGLVGSSHGAEIVASHAAGSVNGGSYVGGLVGYNNNGLFYSRATGSVDGDYAVGGLAGYNIGRILYSHATGSVTGRNKVGGLVGHCQGKGIGGSYATGSVSGTEDVGGLVGRNSAIIGGSYATGSVSGTKDVGGLVGRSSSSGSISASYATGPSSGANRVGGLVGDNSGWITAGYATGSVSGTEDVGGLVGFHWFRGISASYATGQVSGTNRVGGLVGFHYADLATIHASYFDTQTSGRAVALGNDDADNSGAIDGDETASAGAAGQTTAALQSPTGHTGIYAGWNLNVYTRYYLNNPWDFGSATQYPALEGDFNGDLTYTWQEFGYQTRRPLSLTASVSGLHATLSWDDVTESAWTGTPQVSYVLYRDGAAVTDYDGSSRSYVDTDLTLGQRYAYQVALLLDGVKYRRSNEASVTPLGEPLSFGDARLYDYPWHQNLHNGRLDLPAATGGVPPLTYSVSPDLPPGLVFDSNYRTIDGIPAEAQGRVQYTYTVTDANGDTASLPFSILVIPDLEPDFGGATIDNQDYTAYTDIGTVVLPAATGGNGGLNYTLTPELPAGLSFDAVARTITGTPTEGQAETEYTYTATDYDDDTASLTFTIHVQASVITGSAANPVPVWEGESASYTVSLGSAPTESVVVELSSDNSDVTVQPASLTFTSDNWETAQTVTLSVGEDDDRANEQAVISHRIGGETLASVNVSVTDDESDRGILRDFYQATAGANWTNNDNWLSNQPLSQWHGVTVNGQGQVTHLALRDNNLSGSLPAQLGKLETLQALSLDRNSIGGSLPVELGNLRNLTRLAMNRNSLTGAIPTELGSLSSLSIIGLARNSLSGSLPTSLGNLSGLTKLSLHDNTALSGALPSGFTNLANLQRLAIANTGLCAPNTQAFSDWLDTVSDKPGGVPTCE